MGGGIAAKFTTFNIHGVANTSDHGIRLSRVTGATVHNGNIIGYKYGVVTQDATEGLNIQHVSIRDVNFGIDIAGAGQGNVITSNQIWTYHWGINLSNSAGDIAIVNNQINRLGELEFIGIDVHGSPGAVNRPRIIGNTIYSAQGPTGQYHIGIRLWDKVNDPVIQGNITQGMHYGIWLAGPPGSPASVISGSLVFGNINRNAGTAIINDGTNTSCVTNAPAC
jgi:hypothetical protein